MDYTQQQAYMNNLGTIPYIPADTCYNIYIMPIPFEGYPCWTESAQSYHVESTLVLVGSVDFLIIGSSCWDIGFGPERLKINKSVSHEKSHVKMLVCL